MQTVGKHETGFARIERDFYPTPSWVVEALAEHVDLAGMHVWECACGDGRMAEALKAAGASVYATDIEDRGYAGIDAVLDFVAEQFSKAGHVDAAITNPPFGPRGKLAEQFIRTGLQRIADCPFMALLLPVDFDSAKTRMPLFSGCQHYAGKIILTRRIVWFSNPDPQRENPKENSAWFLWNRNAIRCRLPVILYAPLRQERAPAPHAGTGLTTIDRISWERTDG
jgi:hypothetical protein